MKKIWILFCSVLFLCGCSVQKKEMTVTDGCVVTVFDSGKADAILIQNEDTVLMIDTGLDENVNALIRQLKEKGVTRIDAIYLSHYDKDHVGGADQILSAFTVNHVYGTYMTKESDDITELLEALENKNMELEVIAVDTVHSYGDISLDIDAADGGYENNVSNNSSLIISAAYGENTILFAGDAQNERIKEYLANHDATADILKVPYHGHYQKQLDNLLEAVEPEVTLITNSDEEPEEEDLGKALDVLHEYADQVYETKNGNIVITMTLENYEVSQ